MMSFSTRYHGLKQVQQGLAEVELAKANQELVAAAEHLEDVRQSKRDHMGGQSQLVSGAEWQQWYSGLQALERYEMAQTTRVEHVEREVDLRRQDLSVAYRETKKWENVVHYQLEKATEEQRKQEQKSADEMAALRFGRKEE